MLNAPRTLRSRTFWLDQSGVDSNGPPQVAPALMTSISNLPCFSLTSLTRFSISSVFATLAAIPTALPCIPGSRLSFSIAWPIPCGPSNLRAVIITVFAPALRNAVAAWSPSPREPVERALRRCGENAGKPPWLYSRTSRNQSHFIIETEVIVKIN